MSDLPSRTQQLILAFVGPPEASQPAAAVKEARRDETKDDKSCGVRSATPILSPADYVLLRSGQAEAVVLRDAFLGQSSADGIHRQLQLLRSTGKLRKARMGRGLGRWNEESARGDLMCFSSELGAEQGRFLDPLRTKVKQLVRELQREVHRGSERGRMKLQDDLSMQIACYPGDGARYVRHRDSYSSPLKETARIYTAIYYVNPEYDAEGHGGALRFHFDDEDGDERTWDVQPVMDRLVLFRSDLAEHSVQPAFAERWAITCWVYARFDAGPSEPGESTALPLPPERYASPARPLQLQSNELQEAGEDSIFVSIVSYRDSETWPTIEDMYHTAAFPRRVHVGIVWQIREHGEDEGILRIGRRVCKSLPQGCEANIRSLSVHPEAAAGPVPARAAAQTSLYGGERYYLQIDSHMRFRPNWDAFLVEQLRACGSAKPILTAYPAPYDHPYASGGAVLETRPTLLVPSHFDHNGLLRQRGRLLKETRRTPIRSPLWAAGFSFSSAQLLREVPYDESLAQLFFGEEMSIAIRAFTHGWDFFAPGEQVLYHLWKRDRPTFWEQNRANRQSSNPPTRNETSSSRVGKYNLSSLLRTGECASRQEAHARSVAKVLQLLEATNGAEEEDTLQGAHLLGIARARSDFFQSIGVDAEARTVLHEAEHGGQRPDAFASNGLRSCLEAIAA